MPVYNWSEIQLTGPSRVDQVTTMKPTTSNNSATMPTRLEKLGNNAYEGKALKGGPGANDEAADDAGYGPNGRGLTLSR